MRSLRRTLVLQTSIGASCVLVVAGVLLYAFVRAGLVAELDRSLIEKGRLIAASTDRKPGGLELDLQETGLRELAELNSGACIQVWASDGSVLYRSPSLGRADLERLVGTPDAPALCWLTVPSIGPCRAVGVLFSPNVDLNDDGEEDKEPSAAKLFVRLPEESGRTVAFVMARQRRPLDAALSRLRMLLVFVAVIGVTALAGTLWGVVRRGLRPLDDVAEQIGRLGEQDLSSRIGIDPPVRELQPVLHRLNGLLDRLGAAFQRERSFSADVAHELRTPLAGMRSTLEVALARERGNRAYRQALEEALGISVAMQGMVEKLLSLSRLELPQPSVSQERVVVNELLRDCWGPFARRAQERELRVEWTLGPGTELTTDRSLLELVLRNLMENAAEYADEGGVLHFETKEENGAVTIEVANTGSSLSQEEADHSFERFWRGDAARTDTGIHGGLGLAVVSRALDLIGGKAQALSQPGGEFRVVLVMPIR
jgi:two-component system heavy metal sensor histidine kinase CusS